MYEDPKYLIEIQPVHKPDCPSRGGPVVREHGTSVRDLDGWGSIRMWWPFMYCDQCGESQPVKISEDPHWRSQEEKMSAERQ